MTLKAASVPPAIDSPVLQAQLPQARASPTAEQLTAARRPVATFGINSAGMRLHGNGSGFVADDADE